MEWFLEEYMNYATKYAWKNVGIGSATANMRGFLRLLWHGGEMTRRDLCSRVHFWGEALSVGSDHVTASLQWLCGREFLHKNKKIAKTVDVRDLPKRDGLDEQNNFTYNKYKKTTQDRDIVVKVYDYQPLLKYQKNPNPKAKTWTELFYYLNTDVVEQLFKENGEEFW